MLSVTLPTVNNKNGKQKYPSGLLIRLLCQHTKAAVPCDATDVLLRLAAGGMRGVASNPLVVLGKPSSNLCGAAIISVVVML